MPRPDAERERARDVRRASSRRSLIRAVRLAGPQPPGAGRSATPPAAPTAGPGARSRGARARPGSGRARPRRPWPPPSPYRPAVERARPPQASEHVVEGKRGPSPELDADGLLGLGQRRAARRGGAHPPVAGRGAPAPLGDGLRVQPVLAGELARRRFRRPELGSNSRRRAGWTAKACCQRASSCSSENAPPHPEIKHLGPLEGEAADGEAAVGEVRRDAGRPARKADPPAVEPIRDGHQGEAGDLPVRGGAGVPGHRRSSSTTLPPGVRQARRGSPCLYRDAPRRGTDPARRRPHAPPASARTKAAAFAATSAGPSPGR
jgi:hypothetical protein